MEEKCRYCDSTYKSIGKHWGSSPEHQPELTKRQYEILKGFLMSDGSIGKRGRNSPRYILELSNKQCVYWVADELSNIYPRISKVERDRYKDSWRLTVSHKQFKEFVGWYGESGKKYPKDISLTPISLSTWYAGDGGLNNPAQDRSRKEVQMRIKCMKEMDNWSACEYALGSIIDVAPTYTENGYISFGWKDTLKTLNRMEVIPGYEYKWTL